MNAFIARCSEGLKDPAMEIKISAHLVFQRIVKICPNVNLDLEALIEPLKAVVFAKTKETAVKQEIENNRILVLSALKAVSVLNTIADARKVKWASFIEEIQSPQSNVCQLFAELQL